MRLLLAASLFGGVAYAESQAEIAARLNEEGKQLMFAEKYAEASAKFQDAHSRVPEPKYFYNHCMSLTHEGKFGEALTACNAAEKNADPALKEKIAKLDEKLHQEAKKQGIDLQPVGGGGGPGDTPPVDPNNPNPPPTDPNNPGGTAPPQQNMAVGRPISGALFAAAPPENKYTWSLGIDLYGGSGKMGRSGYFGKSTGGLRIKGDYLFDPARRIGTQAYFQLTHFGQGTDMASQGAFSLDVFDLGISGYKHLCGPRARVCLTPLVGVQLALMSPANETDASTGEQVFNYASVGARLELGLTYALGRRYEHVLGIAAGLNAYTKVFSEPTDGVSAMEWGLDKGGAAGYFGLGYTYRFNTPFGSAPFVTLE
ncbi:MAG TPA: hypothetical protein VIV40_19535 [Kofleriaceae bacterium]